MKTINNISALRETVRGQRAYSIIADFIGRTIKLDPKLNELVNSRPTVFASEKWLEMLVFELDKKGALK